MKGVHSQERIIVSLLVAIALLLNVFVWVGKVSKTPQGHDFIPTHNSLSDYAFYTSVIRQGMSGQISVFDRFAVEQHEGSAIHIFYLMIGWVGSWLGFSSAHTVYHLARYILGLLWCLTIYSLIKVSIKEKWVRIIALGFTLFSASFPRFTWVNGVPAVSWYMTWWSELDPVIRVAFVPHFTMGHIMLVTTFICVIKYIQFSKESGLSREAPVGTGTKGENQQIKVYQGFSTWWHTESRNGNRWIVRAVVASFIAGFVHPPSAIQILLVMPILILLIRTQKILVIGIASLCGAGIGLLIIHSISSLFPWNLPRIFEGWSFALSVGEYLLALGPVIIFAGIGVVSVFSGGIVYVVSSIVGKTKRIILFPNTQYKIQYTPFIILFLWIFTSVIMIPLSLQMPFSSIAVIRANPISNIRFLQMAVWIPLSIFGAYGFWFLWKKSSLVLRLLLIGILSFLTFVGYPITIEEQLSHMYFSAEYQYPQLGYLQGVRALADITQLNQSIMSLSLAGMTIPTYINRTVYVGQLVYTPDIDKKLSLAWSFYKGSMSPCEAYKLIKKNNIGSVLYSFDEKNAGDAVKFYPFLQPWNSYGDTQLYKVVDVAPAGCEI